MIEHLIIKVQSSAEWRAEKAKQYPDDTRNAHSSQALTKLAEKLEALPNNDENSKAYDAVVSRLLDIDGNGADKLVEFESQYIGRYGFDYPQNGDPAEFLSVLTEHCQELLDKDLKAAAEKERQQAYEEAKETADEAAKEAADEAAKEAAEEAAKEAAEKAYKKAYDETYKEVYEETYRDALIEALT